MNGQADGRHGRTNGTRLLQVQEVARRADEEREAFARERLELVTALDASRARAEAAEAALLSARAEVERLAEELEEGERRLAAAQEEAAALRAAANELEVRPLGASPRAHLVVCETGAAARP